MTFPASDLERVRAALGGGAPVLITAHERPDPDAIGAVLAMREIAQRLGAVPHVVLSDPVPARCMVLPGADEVKLPPDLTGAALYRVVFVLDSGNLARIGAVQELLDPGALIVNIDHHFSNDRFGAVNLVDLESAATCELLFGLCEALGIALTPSLADCLYAGILTDTGRFRYPSTTRRTLCVAGDLVAAGAQMTRLTDALYYDIPPQDVFSVSRIYSTLELFGGGLVSTLFCRLENLVEDPDTVVDTALSIRGVQVAALLTEMADGKIRVSLRSKRFVNVAAVAELFGGGGHEKAAGFRMRGTLESVRERLLPVLLEALAAPAREAAATEGVERRPA